MEFGTLGGGKPVGGPAFRTPPPHARRPRPHPTHPHPLQCMSAGQPARCHPRLATLTARARHMAHTAAHCYGAASHAQQVRHVGSAGVSAEDDDPSVSLKWLPACPCPPCRRRTLHRDVKSGNILLTSPLLDPSRPPQMKLGDVGVSKVTQAVGGKAFPGWTQEHGGGGWVGRHRQHQPTFAPLLPAAAGSGGRQKPCLHNAGHPLLPLS